MGDRTATVVINFTGNAEDADRKLTELLEKAKAGITVPVTFEQAQSGGGGSRMSGAEAATFGNTAGVATTTATEAAGRLEALGMARASSTSIEAATGLPGSTTGGVVAADVQSAGQIISERTTARQATGAPIPTVGVPSAMPGSGTTAGDQLMAAAAARGAAKNATPGYELPADIDPKWLTAAVIKTGSTKTKDLIEAVQSGVLAPHPGTALTSPPAPMTQLDRLADSAEKARTAAVINQGTPAAGAYQTQAQREAAALTSRMSDVALPGLESQKSTALMSAAQDQSRADLTTRNLNEAQRLQLQTRVSSLQANNPLLSLGQATGAALSDMNAAQREQDKADRQREKAEERTDKAHDAADFAQFKQDERIADRASSASGTRIGRINARLENVQAALAANRGGPDEAALSREETGALGDQAIERGTASPIDGGPPEVPGMFSRTNLRRTLSRYGAIGLGLNAASQAGRAAVQFGDIGANPTGTTATQPEQQALAGYQAGRSLASIIPLVGGDAYDFGGALGNALATNSWSDFESEPTRLAREANVAQSRSDRARRGIGDLYNLKRSKTYSIREQIALDAEEEQRTGDFETDQKADLTDEDRAQEKLDTKNRAENRKKERLKQFGASIEAGYAGAEVDREAGDAAVSRDSVGSLYAQTYGRAYSVAGTSDPEQQKVREYQAKVAYDAGLKMIQRDNAEATQDTKQQSYEVAYTGDRRFADAAYTRNEGERDKALRNAGVTGDAAKDALSGATARATAVNNLYDANNVARDKEMAFTATQQSTASIARLDAVSFSSSGQNLAAQSLVVNANRDAQVAALDRSDKNYSTNVATVNRNAAAQNAAAAGQFVMQNSGAAINLQGNAAAAQQQMSGEFGAAARTQVNTQYAAAMNGFDWGSTGATRQAALSRYQGVYSQFQAGQRAAGIADQRNELSAQTSYGANNAALADNPLGSQLVGIAGRFAQQTAGMDPNSTDYKRARGVANSELAVARQGFNNQTKMIDLDQQFTGKALDRQTANDPIGAQAFQIAGAGLQSANQLAFSGRGKEAEEARRQTEQRLDNLKKDYGRSFRGEEVDLQNIAINNPRDAQDPKEVFAQIAAARGDVAGATLGGDGLGGDKGAQAILGALTKGATLDDIVAAINKLTPEQ